MLHPFQTTITIQNFTTLNGTVLIPTSKVHMTTMLYMLISKVKNITGCRGFWWMLFIQNFMKNGQYNQSTILVSDMERGDTDTCSSLIQFQKRTRFLIRDIQSKCRHMDFYNVLCEYSSMSKVTTDWMTRIQFPLWGVVRLSTIMSIETLDSTQSPIQWAL
jgi:hypothetical protein